MQLTWIVFNESVCGLRGVSLRKGGVTSAELSSVAVSPAVDKNNRCARIKFLAMLNLVFMKRRQNSCPRKPRGA